MTKLVTILGVGNRICGTGDKGPYDFRGVSFYYEDDRVIPFRAGHCNLPWMASEHLKPNTNYWVELKFFNYAPVITAVYREDC